MEQRQQQKAVSQSVVMMHAIVDYCVDGEQQRQLVRQAQELAPGNRLCIELSRDDSGEITIRSFVEPAALLHLV